MSSLSEFKSALAISIFGITVEDAISKHICIRCKSPIETQDWEPADIDEYLISGLCPLCFAEITKKEE